MAERKQRASEQGATILQGETIKKSATIKIAREILETNLAIDIVISWGGEIGTSAEITNEFW